MYNPDDKDIDRLSRDAAEHYHAPGKPSWDALQQILDKELPQDKEKKRRGFFFFFFLLLGISVAGSGIWYGIKINNKNKAVALTGKTNTESKAMNPVAKHAEANNNLSPENNATATVSSAKTNNVSKKNDVSKAGSKIAPDQHLKNNNETGKLVPATKKEAASENTADKAIKQESASIAKNTLNIKNNNKPIVFTGKRLKINQQVKNSTGTNPEKTIPGASKNKIDYTLKLHKKHLNENAADVATANATVTGNKHRDGESSVENAVPIEKPNRKEADIASNNTSADKTKNDTGISVNGKNYDQPVAAAQDTTANKTTVVKSATSGSAITKIDKKDSAAVAKKKSKSKNEKAINIGLTAGLDWSTVKFTHGDNAGYNFGLMGGYQFRRHWAVYTGIIYTKKNYELNGSDYHPPKHYWTQYVDLQKVEGYCRMWEVPLLARYTFNPGSKTAFFVSTGISSYFMKKQDYNYSYKNMGVPGTSSWRSDSSFNHVFSILHLSAGFEKRFGKHMNWQIEPYAKIPLGGVGFGNIRLSSFGVNFSVQYKHPVKR